LFSITFDILMGGNKLQEGIVFATPDGNNLIIGSVFNLNEALDLGSEQSQASLKCEDVKKAATAKLEAFVVSYCPYGLQMQRVLAPIAKLLPDNVTVRYLGSVENGKVVSMHGGKEAEENLRQICIREEQKDKFWDYLDCFIKAGDSNSCLASATIDTARLSSCMADPAKGTKYAEADFALSDKYGTSGSPTLILNGVKVSEFEFAAGAQVRQESARSSDNVKNLLCCGYSQKPSACSQELALDAAATSFSESYSAGSNGSSAAANCG
jgi:hypothetical protein